MGFLLRLIIGFIFFGFLFYVLSVYFPEAFQAVVSWMKQGFDAIRELIEKLVGKVNKTASP